MQPAAEEAVLLARGPAARRPWALSAAALCVVAAASAAAAYALHAGDPAAALATTHEGGGSNGAPEHEQRERRALLAPSDGSGGLHPSATTTRAPGKPFAILLAGTLVRYFPNLDVHVVGPLARANYSVDVYLSLFVGTFKSFGNSGDRYVMHPAFAGRSMDEVGGMIADGIAQNGGRVGALRMPESVDLTPAGDAWVEGGEWFEEWPGAPNDGGTHAKSTRANFAKLYTELLELWTLATGEEERIGTQYEYVMIFRDDSNWLFDFDMKRLVDTAGFVKTDGHKGRVYAMQCDGTPFLGPRTSDFMILAERSVAEPFASLYKLFTDSPHNLQPHGPLYHDRTTFAETYLVQVAKAFDVRWTIVPAALFPFVRSGRMNKSNSVVLCKHYRCDYSFNGVPKMGSDDLIPDTCW